LAADNSTIDKLRYTTIVIMTMRTSNGAAHPHDRCCSRSYYRQMPSVIENGTSILRSRPVQIVAAASLKVSKEPGRDGRHPDQQRY